MSADSSQQSALKSLIDVSCSIGRDRMLIQGPGGNTSVKFGDELWVKASGTWLADADKQQIFVPLSIDRIRQELDRGDDANNMAAIISDKAPNSLRPSIETALHALMDFPAVIHAHAINSLVVATLVDGYDRIRSTLGGDFDVAWIPYRRPGAPLALELREVLNSARADVIVLQNHGIVIGADDPQAAESKLRAIEERLHQPCRRLPDIDIAMLKRAESETFEAIPEASGLAHEDESVKYLCEAPLFPDQVVFLGGAVPLSESGETPADSALRVSRKTGRDPALVVVAGVGVFRRRTRSANEDCIIGALIDLALRRPEGTKFQGLSRDDQNALVNWDAEAYRISLAKA